MAPLTEALLINAARAQHVVELIEPALRGGAIVLCDRFVDSTLAYQGYGRGIELAFLQELCDTASGGLIPNLTFVLDLPVAVSRERVASRDGAPAIAWNAKIPVFTNACAAVFSISRDSRRAIVYLTRPSPKRS